MALHDLPVDEENSPKKEPSAEWKEKHKIYLSDEDIQALNIIIECERLENENKSRLETNRNCS